MGSAPGVTGSQIAIEQHVTIIEYMHVSRWAQRVGETRDRRQGQS
jgi:hypothetical protein